MSVDTARQEQTVIPRLREDLVVTRQKFESRTYYVVKDPISLQYFRVTAEDYFLATLFDGKRTFAEVRETYLRQLPHVQLELTAAEIDERILRFANDLALMQFLSVQGARLKHRFDAIKARKKSKGWLYNAVNSLFFSRFSVYDPDELFGKMARPLWWIWTRTTLWISIALVAAAVVVFIRNQDVTSVLMSQFFSFNNLVLIWVTTILIKSIHELGHGLTCKHFGGEVHEVGVMMLVFTPYFFVNVSDSWVMPKRRHRILISAAGIYVELVLAAAATFLWAVVQPGPFQQLLYNVMVIASISTIVFNANPLMRFDGYYIMTDLLEVPNLQTKSRAFVGHKVKQLLFGRNTEDQTMSRLPLPRKRLWLFYTYAVASFLYGYFVIYKLTLYMAPHLAPFGLEKLATWFSVTALLAWVVVPIYSFFKGLQLTRKDLQPHGRIRRLALIGGAALAIFAVLCCLPRQVKIKRAGAVELAQPEAVRPEISGFVGEVYVKEGDRVQAGAPLAKLINREVTQNLHAAQERLRIADALVQRAMGLEKPEESRQAEATRAQYQSALAEAQRNLDHLVLRANTNGTVLTRDLQHSIGRLLKSGELFCAIAPLDSMLIKVPLSEQQVRYVKKGQRVVLKTAAYPGKTLTGEIASDPLTFVGKDMPPAFSSRRQGDVAVATDREGREIPLERTYQAQIRVDNREGFLRQGMTGRAKIYAGRQLYGKLVLQSLLDLVSLDYR